MMAVMHERHLCLSKRKTRFGAIEESGFHFLGILIRRQLTFPVATIKIAGILELNSVQFPLSL